MTRTLHKLAWLIPAISLTLGPHGACGASVASPGPQPDPTLVAGPANADNSPSAAPSDITFGTAEAAIGAAVLRTLQFGHYGGRALDDALSEIWFDRYLDYLDGGRLYFTAADIAELRAYARSLDDDLLAPTPRFEALRAMWTRYRQRTVERLDAALRLLDGPLPLDRAGDRVTFDREDAPWAASAGELDALWLERLREQALRLALQESVDAVTPELRERLKKRLRRQQADLAELEPADVLEGYLNALTTAFDPHSVWLKPMRKEDFDIDMRDALTGIGAVLTSEDGVTTIRELVVGGPAEQSELLAPGDQILGVGQSADAIEDVVDLRLDKVVRMIRGPKGQTVHLRIHPADATDPAFTRVVPIVRDLVKLERASAKASVETVDRAGQTVRVGVIEVPAFYKDRSGRADAPSTTNDVRRLLTELAAQDLDVAMLDLRGNSGGYLDEAVSLTGLFLDTGSVVQVRDREGKVEVLRDTDRGVAWAGPLVVLTDDLSASASEIFAAAIQDHGRGLVVGARATHGKGTVQNLADLARLIGRAHPDLAEQAGALKYTSHMFFRVDGRSTQIEGVRADIVLPSPWDGLEVHEADLDHALPWDQIAPTSDFTGRRLSLDLPALRAASALRMGASVPFAFLREDVARREAAEADPTVSLHLPTRKAEIARLDKIAEDHDATLASLGYETPDEVDPIKEEAVRIAADFVGGLRKGNAR